MSMKNNVLIMTASLMMAFNVSAQLRDPTAPLGGGSGRVIQTKKAPVARTPYLSEVICNDESNQCVAFINGSRVSVGQRVSGYQVSQIRENSVTLRRDDRVLSLTVFNEQVVQ